MRGTTGINLGAKIAALKKKYTLAHCHGKSTSPGSTIVPMFWRFVSSNEAKPPSKNAALTKQCALALCHVESTSPSSTILPYIFSRLIPSDAAKLPGSNAG